VKIASRLEPDADDMILERFNPNARRSGTGDDYRHGRWQRGGCDGIISRAGPDSDPSKDGQQGQGNRPYGGTEIWVSYAIVWRNRLAGAVVRLRCRKPARGDLPLNREPFRQAQGPSLKAPSMSRGKLASYNLHGCGLARCTVGGGWWFLRPTTRPAPRREQSCLLRLA